MEGVLAIPSSRSSTRHHGRPIPFPWLAFHPETGCDATCDADMCFLPFSASISHTDTISTSSLSCVIRSGTSLTSTLSTSGVI